MSSPLHQMTMGFSAEDDRLLLRLSTRDMTEYQLWLTRSFVKVLWGALIQILEKAPLPDAAFRPGRGFAEFGEDQRRTAPRGVLPADQ